MTKPHNQFEILKDNQASASVPVENVWLSASAGTGKTHVLAARVYRLLLADVKPESILCLTFTKAGAAEMAERINTRLAQWVRLSGPALATDLKALGEDFGLETVAKARKLFARVLDARGGGLRIQTIHSFCQSMLGAFPAEIGLTPGFRAMEAREQGALAARVLGDMVISAEADGRLGVLDNLRTTVLRLGEDRARKFLSACAQAKDALEALGEGDALRVNITRALCDGLADPEGWLLLNCNDAKLPHGTINAVLDANAGWFNKSKPFDRSKEGIRVETIIRDWLSGPSSERVAALTKLSEIWLAKDGKRRKVFPPDPNYPDMLERFITWADELLEVRKGAVLAAEMAAALSVGRDYARAYADAKRAEGLVDFDDLIVKTVALLEQENIGQWIKYKLDQTTDHVLIDEAQDTNANQWKIVDALTDEFFSGDGAKSVVRTVFTVGDYKQAIFGFQGTNPKEFAAAKTRLMARARDAGRDIVDLSLSESFRSSQPILDVVDGVIAHIGADKFGLSHPDPNHESAMRGRGTVTLWPPVGDSSDSDDEDDDHDQDQDTSDDITPSDRMFAATLAKEIKAWLDNPRFIECKNRPLRPEDIMILLRSRGDMARLIVSQLHGEGVPVAGLDRLRLNAPLAVRDLLACIRFVLQPGDDLNLATLLVSPIIGWDQQQLYDLTFGRKVPLWEHIRGDGPPALPAMLKIADQVTPYRFLETILSGAIDARRKLIARMGAEIRDPVEELLNAALSFEGEATASLQQFLDWFDRGDVDVTRNLSEPDNAVRVMTVHGAKGLQAPVVILADATRDPSVNRSTMIDWTIADGVTVPVFKPRAAEIVTVLKKAADVGDAKEREEHWRLLYVAMTRAEEHLYIGGALSKAQAKNGEVSANCWHHGVAMAMGALGADKADDATLTYTRDEAPKRRFSDRAKVDVAEPTPPPAWLHQAAPEEARPPRPLAPSSLGNDDAVQPPPAATMRAAAERGRLLHSLFERLPDVAPLDRQAAGLRWLEQAGGVDDAVMRAALVRDALAVIDHPDFAPLFEGDALAEAPIAGVVAGLVIAGTVDRLIVTETAVTVIDYKTGSRIPRDVASAPRAHLQQMSAYAALLGGIFPDHDVRAGLLYTSGPVLHMLDGGLIEAHKPPYDDVNQALPPLP